MKKLRYNLLFAILIFISNVNYAQTAYIQVNGESNLSVFLNNQFKGKTTVELKGYIIENVSAGKNLIKIVKEGYTPFEEYVIIKSGEVFAYNVKPFLKQIVKISEQGNSGETDKTVKVETGRLVIQSVPIEIKISIPDIEGVNNVEKTKDKWLADKIPAGNYEVIFTFNQKSIKKTIQIRGNDTINAFVNMLNGEFKSTNSIDVKRENERLENENRIKGEAIFMNYTYFKYYDIGLTLEEAKIKFPEYFNKFSVYKYTDQELFDRAYSSKNPDIGLTLYGKNGKIVGCYGTLKGRVQDDANFTKGNSVVKGYIDDWTKMFGFKPEVTVTPYNQGGYKYNQNSYTWRKNGKMISVTYVQWYFSNGYTTEISFSQFDNMVVK